MNRFIVHSIFDLQSCGLTGMVSECKPFEKGKFDMGHQVIYTISDLQIKEIQQFSKITQHTF